MLDWTRPVTAGGVFVLLGLADHLGLDTEPLLREAGLPPRAQLNGDTQVTGVHEVALLRAVQERAPLRLDLGLVDSKPERLSQGGTIPLLLLSARDLRHALELNQRFLTLSSTMVEFEVTEAAGWLTITFSAVGLPSDVSRFYLQRTVNELTTMVRQQGHTGPIRTSFPFPAPTDPHQLARYDTLLGVPPVFKANVATMRVPVEVTRTPLPGSAPELLRILVADAERQLAEHRSRVGVTSEVRALIRASLPERISVDQAADALMVAPRTLRRQLLSEGTSFRELLDGVRAQVAAETLTLRQVPMVKLAEELGFANPSAFSTAFQRWYGCTPTQYLALAAAGTPPPHVVAEQ